MYLTNITLLAAIVAASVEGASSIRDDGKITSSALSRCVPSTFAPLLPNTHIIQITANPVKNFAIPAQAYNFIPPTPQTTVSFCNVTVTYTHPGWNDNININVNLPLQGWNGRFLATGGERFATGTPLALQVAVYLGYASAGTDGGHFGEDMSWAIKKPRTLINYPLLVDFASESLKDMAAIGKQVVSSYYGQPAKYNYWTGCSMGGRQGLLMAQRYPDLFDGILANSPVINFSELLVTSTWAQAVMHDSHTVPPPCILEAFTAATIAACDGLDGLKDGIIDAPDLCTFDANSMVGQKINCNGTTVTFTKDYAHVLHEIMRGAHLSNGTQLWYGLNPGTDLTQMVATTCTGTATDCTPVIYDLSEIWLSNFVVKDATYTTSEITSEQVSQFLSQSKDEYDWIMATNDADLRHLRRTKTKVLTFHGLADPLVFPNGTISYYQRVLENDPKAADYYRLFEAPGVQHCAGGNGPNPYGILNSLVDWVEHGKAPTQVDAVSTAADGTTGHQPLCAYPLVSAYQGGDPKLASSYKCEKNFRASH